MRRCLSPNICRRSGDGGGAAAKSALPPILKCPTTNSRLVSRSTTAQADVAERTDHPYHIIKRLSAIAGKNRYRIRSPMGQECVAREYELRTADTYQKKLRSSVPRGRIDKGRALLCAGSVRPK